MSLDWEKIKKDAKEPAERDADMEDASVGKILFTGLDNGGKTSIILALQREYARIAILQPTRHTQRRIFSYLGREIAEWDLGGQARYRIAYIRQPGRYLDRTSVCIYTIDVQDTARLQESLSYLRDVVQKFDDLAIQPPIYVFLHKYDPDWVTESPVKRKQLLEDIKTRVHEINRGRHEIGFFTTSIFRPWSIMSAFSEILLDLFPKSELVDKTVSEFATKIDADGILVLDNNSLILAQYYRTDEDREVFKNTTPYFLTLHDGFMERQSSAESMSLEIGGNYYLFTKVTTEESPDPRYLLIKKSVNEFNPREIQSFTKIFFDLLLD